jgi:serine/threonine protein kinase
VILAARDSKGRECCIKLFKERLESISERHDLFSELNAARQLKHPNILPVLDFGEHAESGRAFLVMPLCKRGNLEGILRAKSFLPLHEAIPILDALAGAIDYAHQSGFVHGDIKLANILLADSPDRPCLSDFGMAKYFVNTTSERMRNLQTPKPKRRQSTQLIISKGGTVSYLSPEQVSLGIHSPKSDIYSFAMVAYELVTGSLPFREHDPFFYQLKAKIEGKIVPPAEANSALSRAVCDALTLGLEVDPKRRPESAREFVDFIRGDREIPRRILSPPGPSETADSTKAVFVVHGHEHGVRETVARFLERLGLEPVIIMEQPGEGRTIIEQIERYSTVAAAVVIMTADDLGTAKQAAGEPQPRARQNVVLELGYFIGKLGRDRTTVLCEPGVEMPSDFSGVVYHTLDSGGAWRLRLARSLAAMSLPVDIRSLVS